MIIREDNIKKHRTLNMKSVVAGISIAASLSTFSSCSNNRSLFSSKLKRPNIVYIMTDDHTQQAISAFGSTLIDTPNIDRLANEGVKFTNSFVTNSICAPSRAVMLTGKYSHENGLRDNQDEFDSSQQTYPSLLHEDGYNTAMIGKWHLASEPVGFDTYQILTDAGGQGVYYNPNFKEDGTLVHHTGYVTDIITDKAIDFMDSVKSDDKPFSILVHQKAPHRNWMPNTKYLGAFEDVEFPIPETFNDDYATRSMAALADMKIKDMYLSQDMKLHPDVFGEESGTGGLAAYKKYVVASWEHEYNNMTEEQRTAWDKVYDPINKEYAESNMTDEELANWKFQRYMRDYLACVLSVDESVGRILDYLDENGLTENTIVVYTSDQGFYMGEHGWFDKRWMYEESLRTPLLIRYPARIEPGKIVDSMVLNLDFAPTFLDFAGYEVPEDIQGESMVGLLTKKKAPKDWRTSIYYHYYEYPDGWHSVRRHFGVRTEKYKLIDFYNQHYKELFDLEKDPNELNNIYENPAYTGVVEDLEAELERLREYYGDDEY